MQVRSSFIRERRIVYRWLISGCILIGLIVVVGGITRLTQSGLSMVKWEPVVGAIPPLSEKDWQESFDLYKQTPEFQIYNNDFTLQDYMKIYFWEYLHRLIGRIIGLVFLIPGIYYWLRGYFDSKLKRSVLIIFCWGLFQGILGWFMVKSGLKDVPHVSHIRLAAHFVTAVSLILYIYYTALTIKYKVHTPNLQLRKKTAVLIVLLFLQVVYGAFVSGLKAGLMYNSFPKMNGSWIPDEMMIFIEREGMSSLFLNAGWVQFIHRWIPVVIFTYFLYVLFFSRKWNLSTVQKLGLGLTFVLLIIQIVLGVTTLILAVPIELGVIHQLVALLLLLAVTFTLFTSKKQINYD